VFGVSIFLLRKKVLCDHLVICSVAQIKRCLVVCFFCLDGSQEAHLCAQLADDIRAYHAEQHVVAALRNEVLAAINDHCPELLVLLGEINRIVVDVADHAERGRLFGILGAEVLKGGHLNGHVMDDHAPLWVRAAPLAACLVGKLCVLGSAAVALTIAEGTDDALALGCMGVCRCRSRSRSGCRSRRRRTATLTSVPHGLLNGKTSRTAERHYNRKEA
jgi:hypothetical protein